MDNNKTENGYFGIGVYRSKYHENIGTLWRSALQFGASFIFTIGARYKNHRTDTYSTSKKIPLFQFNNLGDFEKLKPRKCPVIPIDFGRKTKKLEDYNHPEKCIYLLEAEDDGLPEKYNKRKKLRIPSVRENSFNVAMSGSIVMYDRLSKNIT